MTQEMDREAFARLLDVHGADMARWPVDAQAAAQALLLKDAQARALLEEARTLDDLLRADAVPPADEGLEQRILAAAEITAAQRQVSVVGASVANDNDRKPWWMAVPMAASLLLGVWLGFSGALGPVQEVLLAAADQEVASIMEIAAPVDDEGELL